MMLTGQTDSRETFGGVQGDYSLPDTINPSMTDHETFKMVADNHIDEDGLETQQN